MRKIRFFPHAINNLKKFKFHNQNLAFKVLKLITDIPSSPFTDLGKTAPLKENYSSFWWRRINDEHQLLCTVTDNLITIHSCFGHT